MNLPAINILRETIHIIKNGQVFYSLYSNTENQVMTEHYLFGGDHGYIVESLRQDKIEDTFGYKVNFIQCNESSTSKGVLRGRYFICTK